MNQDKIALVLSGGGAKGAYQVGVIKALNELGARVDAIAGASIGALNGAVVASAPSLGEAAERLQELWMELAHSSPLRGKIPSYLTMLIGSGLELGALGTIKRQIESAQGVLGRIIPPWLNNRLDGFWNSFDSGMASDIPLREMLGRYLDPMHLELGIPLYVSVFRSQGAITGLLRCLIAELGMVDSPESEFLHIQSLPMKERTEALLASASIPLLFAPVEVNGSLYSDGGQGGWGKMQGNTPIAPLLEAGYKTIIVTHLSDGSLWSRQDFPDATILEIRPQTAISKGSAMGDMLGFDNSKIPLWIDQGFSDTKECIGKVMQLSSARWELRQSEERVRISELMLDPQNQELERAMARLSLPRCGL